ncbi:hypothetical protein [Clostridium sp. KNHs205]|uniref:hypothetical protein n=1 Tax=Clostridium sp. KNHs205 TaxID=1449050 RepID=UPI00051C3E99|nr:hypothetical protein [Clostridium sp. KNHs205]
MNIPIDVIAIFDHQGNITPSYVRLEDEKHKLINHKVTDVKLQQDRNYAGIATIDYLCKLDDGRSIELMFFTREHKWVIKP